MIRHSVIDDDHIFYLEGHLTESDVWPSLKPRYSSRIIFDCKKVSSFNSFFVARWMDWLRQMDPRIQFVFRHCNERVVDLFNSINGFAPAEYTIESFLWPMMCDNCHHEETLELVRGVHFIEALSESEGAQFIGPETLNCQKCRETLHVAVVEKKYLQFLNKKRTL